jgi:MFS family permease
MAEQRPAASRRADIRIEWMSASSAHNEPNSSGLERDARRAHRNEDSHRVSPGDIALGVIIGRTSEFFDFFVYALGSVLVFPGLFFPGFNPLQATILSFAVFTLAFIGRPIGTLLFTEVDRRHGRGAKMTMALFLLGVATAGISFLPGTAQIGHWAVLLLAIFRFLQGVALGGASEGLASLLALNAPQNRRGWYAMMPQLGAPLGFLLAAGLFLFLLTTLPRADFHDWGWRYPFFVAFAVNVVALFARLRLVATSEFSTLLEKLELRPAYVTDLARQEGWNVVVGAFVPLASFALFHLVTVFPLAWVVLNSDRIGAGILRTEMMGAVVLLAMVILSGRIADAIGRARLLRIGAVLIGIFSFGAPFILGAGPVGETVYTLVGFGLLGLSFGQTSGALASSFSRQFRYTGSALTSDIAWLIGAGFAPLVALGLSSFIGLFAVGGYLLSGAICTVLALRSGQSLEMRDQ